MSNALSGPLSECSLLCHHNFCFCRSLIINYDGDDECAPVDRGLYTICLEDKNQDLNLTHVIVGKLTSESLTSGKVECVI